MAPAFGILICRPAGPLFITRVCRFDLGIRVRRLAQARRAWSPQIAQASGALAAGSGWPTANAAGPYCRRSARGSAFAVPRPSCRREARREGCRSSARLTRSAVVCRDRCPDEGTELPSNPCAGPCSDQSTSERVPWIGTEATAKINKARSKAAIQTPYTWPQSTISQNRSINTYPACAIHKRSEGCSEWSQASFVG